MSATKPLTPRQADQRNRILTTTREVLAEAGYDGLQMRVLAERSGVSPMTLYNRFGNKDDLILEALQDILAEIANRARSTGARGIALLHTRAQLTADQILDTPAYAKAMARMLFNAQPDSPISNTLLKNGLIEARRRIVEMRSLEEITDAVDHEMLARSLAVCGWATNLLWMQGMLPDADFKRQYTAAPLLVLMPAMAAATRKRYARDLQ